MYWLCGLILLLTLLLVSSGTLPFWPALLLFLLAAGKIFQLLGQSLYEGWLLAESKRRFDGKWAMSVLSFGGINLLPEQRLHLLLNRHDDLLFVQDKEVLGSLKLTEVSTFLAIRGQDLGEISASQLERLLGRYDWQALRFLKCRLPFCRDLRERYYLLLALHPDRESREQNFIFTDDLLCLQLVQSLQSLRSFLKRPEIRAKGRFLGSLKTSAAKQKNR